RQAKERAILDAALDVFAESGFAPARLEEVAARAGVAKGTIYLYFPSKQALFEALIRTGIGAPIEAAGEEAAALELPFEAVVRGLFARMRREILATRRKEIIRLVIAESGRFPELAEFYYREVVARGMALLRAAAERAVARGELSSDELARFPQLVVAPGLVAFLWATLFERFEALDAEAMLEAHMALLLRPAKAKP
ncbi:MAG: TetR/AcrR family transcriptional regulator, partial [Microvirga sp.]